MIFFGVTALSCFYNACSSNNFSSAALSSSSGVLTQGTNPVVCDPNGTRPNGSAYGLSGSLFSNSSRNASGVNQMITGSGVKTITNNLFLSELAIPTTYFSQGFQTAGGAVLTDLSGNLLIEYFAMDLHGQLALADSDPEGYYQFALFADDGAILTLNNGVFIDSDGDHNTQMACSPQALYLQHGSPLPLELKYYQGPRYHIALTLMWRQVASANAGPDVQCGNLGNTYWWDPTTTPPQPTSNYFDIVSRGWSIVPPQNYLLPASSSNPCF